MSIIHFTIFFQKSIDKLEKMLYYLKNRKAVIIISNLIHLFFITFIIYLFITLYSLYTFFDIVLFNNKQGAKLKIKKKSF